MTIVLTFADRLMMRVLDIILVCLAGLLLLLLNYAVFARFVLNESVSWGEELPSHMLAMLAFVGAAYLTRTDEHIGFDGVLRLFPEGLQRIVLTFNFVAMAAFGAALAWYGTIATLSFAARPMISVDLPMALFRGAMPFGGALIALICAVRVAGLVSGRIRPADLLPKTDD